MKKAILTLFGAACLCAAAALKPGYVRHGDLKPSDQVPGDYETVMSNYLATAGYVPSHVTNTLTIVSNVTVNTDHWHTNNVVTAEDHWVTNNFVSVSNVVTHTDHFITNNVTHNFTQNFVYNYTNNFYDVTNRYFYDTQVTTNEIWNVGTNVVYEPHYIVSNFTERIWTTNEWVKEYYNNVYITNHYTDVINNLYTNVFTTVWATNNLVTWATNVIYETTNLYVTTHEDHYVTNNLTLWVTNNLTTHTDHWVTNNFVDYTTHWVTNNLVGTNTTHEIQCVVSNFYDVVYETTNIYNNVYETTNIYNNVYETNNIVTWATSNIVINTHSNIYTTIAQTNREDYFVYLTEVTTNEVTQLRYITNVYTNQYVIDNHVDNSTNYYQYFHTDKIVATNGLEWYEIDAVEKKYTHFKVNFDGIQGWKTSDGGTIYDEADPVPIISGDPSVLVFPIHSVLTPPLTYDSLAMTGKDNSTGGTSAYFEEFPVSGFTGSFNNIPEATIDRNAVFKGYQYLAVAPNCTITRVENGVTNVGWRCGWAFKVLGGWNRVVNGVTNFVNSTSVPKLNDYLVADMDFCYPTNRIVDSVSVYFGSTLHLSSDPSKAIRWGVTQSPSGAQGRYTVAYTGQSFSLCNVNSWWTSHKFTFNSYTAEYAKTNYTARTSTLVGFDEMETYGQFYTASDVVTSAVFRTTMEDAMLPYTYASYTNMTMAASYARKTTTDAAAISNYMNTADQKIAAAIATATDVAVDAKNNAYNYMRSAQTAEGNANSAAGRAQTAQANAEFQYNLIQTFTNWFYTAVNAGQVVTNVHVYYAIDQTARDNVTSEAQARQAADTALGYRISALESYDPSISITDGGVMSYPGAPRYIVPMTLKENNFTSTSSYHPNKTFTFGCIRRGSSNTGGSDTIQICYKNEDFPNSTFHDESNFCSYDYGLTFLWNKNTSKWRVLRKYDSSNAKYFETYAYVTDLDFTWSGTLNSRTVTYTPTTAHLLVNTPCTIDLATQAELNAVVPGLMSDVDSVASLDSGYICTYDVYFDTAGAVQGSFTMKTGNYTTSNGVRTYTIENLSGGPATSSNYGTLSSVTYTWNPTTGDLRVVLQGTKGQRVYTATQDNPIAHYYGAQWSCIKTSQTAYSGGGGAPAIDTTGKTYLDPLVKLAKAASYLQMQSSLSDVQSDVGDVATSLEDLNTIVSDIRSWLTFGTRCVLDVTTYRSTSKCVASAVSTANPVVAGATFRTVGSGGSGNTGTSSPSTYTISDLKPVLTENSGTTLGTSSKLYFTVTYNTGATERDFIFIGKKASELTADTTISKSSVYVYYVTAGTEESPTGSSSRSWRLTGSVRFTPVRGQ